MDDVEKEIIKLIEWIENKGFSDKDVAGEVALLEKLYAKFDEMDKTDSDRYFRLKF